MAIRRRSLIVLVLGTLLGVMAFGVVGSGAFFTDQEEIEDNVASAASLDIELINVNGGSMPFVATGLVPGADWSGPYPFGIYNTAGSMPVLYEISANDITQTEPGMKNKINVKLIPYFSGPLGDCSAAAAYQGPLPGLSGNNLEHPYGQPALPVNWTHSWKLCMALDSSAGNQYQGDTVTFDVVVDASQVEAAS